MEKIDILVKGVPVPVHNMFKGLCSMSGKSVSDGIIEAITSIVDRASGAQAGNPQTNTAGNRRPSRKK